MRWDQIPMSAWQAIHNASTMCRNFWFESSARFVKCCSLHKNDNSNTSCSNCFAALLKGKLAYLIEENGTVCLIKHVNCQSQWFSINFSNNQRRPHVLSVGTFIIQSMVGTFIYTVYGWNTQKQILLQKEKQWKWHGHILALLLLSRWSFYKIVQH